MDRVVPNKHLAEKEPVPAVVQWALPLVMSVGVAVTNLIIVVSTYYLIELSAGIVDSIITSSSVGLTALLLAVFSAVMAALAASIVACVSPVSAGGGLPEMKAYLNGTKIPKLFSPTDFLVRLIGTIAVVASRVPVGREGPTICLGCMVGLGAVNLLLHPHFQRLIAFDLSGEAAPLDLQRNEELWARLQRVGCAAGGAAGISVMFNAPIGGFLYMLQEVTMDAWSSEITLLTFIGTALACGFNSLLLNLRGSSIFDFMISVQGYPSRRAWGLKDAPFMLLTAVVLGAFSSLYNTILVSIFSMRKRMATQGCLRRYQPWAKVVEAALFAGICALLWTMVSGFAKCVETPEHLVELNLQCPKKKSNEVAFLLFKGPEEALKLLYSPDEVFDFDPWQLLLVLVSYFLLNVSMMGLAIPMGAFIPNMFIGAIAGRLIGQGLQAFNPSVAVPFARPSIYSLLGSAAMLGGSIRQNLAIVVFLTECVNDLNLAIPLVVTIFVAERVSKCFTEEGLDEELMIRKGVRYLNPEVSEEAGVMAWTPAERLCDTLPPSAQLRLDTSVTEVQQALQECNLDVFPVLREGRCLGLVTRKRLEGLIKRRITVPDDGQGTLQLNRILDAAPFTLLQNMPFQRLRPLFTRLDIKAACVVSHDGGFVGLLSRDALIDAELRYKESGEVGESDSDNASSDGFDPLETGLSLMK